LGVVANGINREVLRFPSLQESAALLLHCRKALGNMLLHCPTTYIHVGIRFSGLRLGVEVVQGC